LVEEINEPLLKVRGEMRLLENNIDLMVISSHSWWIMSLSCLEDWGQNHHNCTRVGRDETVALGES
jgi:hypothetical protein